MSCEIDECPICKKGKIPFKVMFGKSARRRHQSEEKHET